MFWGSRTHAHQSEFGSFGAPGPMSPWKPAVATPQRKFLGSLLVAPDAGAARASARTNASVSARRAMARGYPPTVAAVPANCGGQGVAGGRMCGPRGELRG